LVKSKEN